MALAEERDSEPADLPSDDSNGVPDPMSAAESKANARKKKKKKKKGNAEQKPLQKSGTAPRKELEARFGQALVNLQRDDPDSTWTQLDNCNIHDGKACSLAAALEKNQELTSLDLSGNCISHRGAEAIARALEGGAAPQLILLNLRDNPIGPEATATMESLRKARRQLKVDLSSGPTSQTSSSDADPDGHEMLEVKASPQKQRDWLHWVDDRGSKALNGDEWSDGESNSPLDEKASSLCWDQITACLSTAAVNVQAVATDLRVCSLGIRKEMAEAKAPLPARTKLDQLQPFTQLTVKNLDKLAAVLDLPASPLLTPYSKDTPVPAAGLHCALVAQIVEQLLSAMCASISVHVLKAGLIPRLTYMAFEFPKNNILQCAMGRAIGWAVKSGLRLLWEPLFKPRMGLSKGGQLRKGNLIERLVASLRRSEKAGSIGRRDCDIGFACSVAETLLASAESNSYLLQCIEESKGGEELTSKEGTLQSLLAVQREELCGPRPKKSVFGHMPGEDSPEGLHGNIQSSALMQLLQQSIDGSHIQDPSESEGDNDNSDEESSEPLDQD